MRKKAYLVEIPLFYLLLYALNIWLTPSYPAFIGLDPHPYWIGIFLFSFRYGTKAGFLTGVAGAGLYLFEAWFHADRYLFEDFYFYVLPASFVLASILLGFGLNHYRFLLDRKEEEKKTLEAREQAATEEIKTLQEINRGLEKRIVTRMSTLVTLYEGARRMEVEDPEGLPSSILHFVTRLLDAAQATLYMKEAEGWVLKESVGFEEGQKPAARIGLNEGMVGLAGSRNQVLSVRDFLGPRAGEEDFVATPGDSLMAGPLRVGEAGEVIGVVGVWKLPLAQFNSAALNLFHFLLQWASRAVRQARSIQQLKAGEIIDPYYEIYSSRYFYSRASQEFARSKTYYLPLTMGLVSLAGLDKITSSQIPPTLKTIAAMLGHCLRDMDVVARTGEDNIPFGLILITTSANQAETIRDKMVEAFGALKAAPHAIFAPLTLKIGLASFTPKTSGVEALIDEAKRGMR